MRGAAGRLIVICGLPGSGKTTLAIELAERHGGVRLCPDDWMAALEVDIWDEQFRVRLEALQWTIAQDLLAAGVTVIIEWGVWAREERDLLRLGARELGVPVELRYLDVPLDMLWERVRGRNSEPRFGRRAMTRADLEEWSTIIQVPDSSELALFDPPA